MATESDVAGGNCILSKSNGYDQKSEFENLLRSSNSCSYLYTVQRNWDNFLNADAPVCSSSQRVVEKISRQIDRCPSSESSESMCNRRYFIERGRLH